MGPESGAPLLSLVLATITRITATATAIAAAMGTVTPTSFVSLDASASALFDVLGDAVGAKVFGAVRDAVGTRGPCLPGANPRDGAAVGSFVYTGRRLLPLKSLCFPMPPPQAQHMTAAEKLAVSKVPQRSFLPWYEPQVMLTESLTVTVSALSMHSGMPVFGGRVM